MKITKWTRKNFPEIDPKLDKRIIAEEETIRDLQKDIRQLLCDSHEEALSNSTVGVLKRINSLLTVVAYESRRTAFWMKWLTIVITVLTAVLVIKEFF